MKQSQNNSKVTGIIALAASSLFAPGSNADSPQLENKAPSRKDPVQTESLVTKDSEVQTNSDLDIDMRKLYQSIRLPRLHPTRIKDSSTVLVPNPLSAHSYEENQRLQASLDRDDEVSLARLADSLKTRQAIAHNTMQNDATEEQRRSDQAKAMRMNRLAMSEQRTGASLDTPEPNLTERLQRERSSLMRIKNEGKSDMQRSSDVIRQEDMEEERRQDAWARFFITMFAGGG